MPVYKLAIIVQSNEFMVNELTGQAGKWQEGKTYTLYFHSELELILRKKKNWIPNLLFISN